MGWKNEVLPNTWILAELKYQPEQSCRDIDLEVALGVCVQPEGIFPLSFSLLIAEGV